MPLKKFYFLFLLIVSINTSYGWFFFPATTKPFVLFIEAAGDAQNTGRTIYDSFERTLSLNLAHELKKNIEHSQSNTQVIINRALGQIIDPLHNANVANKLGVNVYIGLYFYQETDAKPRMNMYHYTNDLFCAQINQTNSFIPYDQAYKVNYKKTNDWAGQIQSFITNKTFDPLCSLNIYKLPIKPLLGIKAPAFIFEIGLKKSEDWHLFIQPVTQILLALIDRS